MTEREPERPSRGSQIAAVAIALVLLLGALLLTLGALFIEGFSEGSDGSAPDERWQGDLQLAIALVGLGLIVAAIPTAASDRVRAAWVLLGAAVFAYALWAALLTSWGVFFFD
jgi:hypothetical protein